eukprot:CAMPEP_0206541820 /NCGR_PEP_ID=MMETSP0325_2-20121206/9828_1 /ASSEMBLY_ACC=CAM_ASM_000347 /TAXON_ID=2866 /ORGANISM="Crypthecodinium cohnii, Strain Seligo" /LENGTH=85 /DNA_ID=CAMNT_0054039807 /DNA_START=111 /DNA_END=368 /DNA_ORIENTATION=+
MVVQEKAFGVICLHLKTRFPRRRGALGGDAPRRVVEFSLGEAVFVPLGVRVLGERLGCSRPASVANGADRVRLELKKSEAASGGA